MRTKFFALFAATALCGMAFTACSDDDKGGNNNGDLVDPSTIATSNLIAYFPFENNGNDLISGMAPSNSTGVTYVLGRRGNAYQGSGSAGTADVAGDPSFLHYTLQANSKIKTLKAFTIAMWIKILPTTDGGPEPMIFQVDGSTDWTWGNFFLIQHRNPSAETAGYSPIFDNYFWKNDASDPDPLPENTWKGQRVANIKNPVGEDGNVTQQVLSFNAWQHLIMTYDNVTSNWYCYVNGVLFDLGAGFSERWQGISHESRLGDLKFNLPTTLTIGAWADVAKGNETWGWAGFFKGGLDEFRIYDRALTATEAAALYSAEVDYMNE